MKSIGLLPLYLELYDETCAFMRPKIENFRDIILDQLESRGLNMVCAPICRLKEEFSAAVIKLEEDGVCAIVTLHLAYSPSLECIDALATTKLPLVVLDTTQSYSFDSAVSADEIMYNHGIHGVQDMCNMLNRRKKPYEIFAGHYQHSDVLDRVTRYCRGTQMGAAFHSARVGLVGSPFCGMGDFYVPFEELNERFGLNIVEYSIEAAERRNNDISPQEIAVERSVDEDIFDWDANLTDAAYDRTTRVCLSLRKWIDEQKLTALTVNFLEAEGGNPGLPVMPFTECSKAMVRGIGYAGEGDVLTAALCGAILQFFPETTFTEMFCPDWKGGSVFLSHMGELNYRVCIGKPRLTEMLFPYTSAENPTVAYGTFKPGKAVFVNLAPCSKGRYALILAPGDVLDVSSENNMAGSINGWFKPRKPLPEFLEMFSRVGGTHHSILVYADCLTEMSAFAAAMKFECVII
jgi:L-arabinose isomerase